MTRDVRWLMMLALLLVTSLAQAGTKHYYYTDPQGTILAKADASGNIIATYDYAPYGTAVASMSPAPNGPGYTGHVNDPDTGLVYMQARYYDPTIGRFLSMDIVAVSAGDVFSSNAYMYVRGNPVGLTDPTGMDPKHGKDMEICNGPVPCETGLTINMVLLSKQVDKVFSNYKASSSTDSQYTAILAEMPGELRMALEYILASPMGQGVAREALARGEKIGFLEIPKGQPLGFRFDMGSGLIIYTLKLTEFKARYVNNPSLLREINVPLDVNLLHEIAHTPVGRSAFGISAHPSTLLNEFEDVRKAENPYRKFYGIPLRTSYYGFDIPDPIIQNP